MSRKSTWRNLINIAAFCTFFCESISRHSESHDNSEGRLPERQLKAAVCLNRITAIAAFGGLIAAAAGVVGLFLLNRTITHADKATIDVNRAWVAVISEGAEFKNLNLILHLRLMNVGKEPAFDIHQSEPAIRFIDLKKTDEEIDWPSGNNCANFDITTNGPVIFLDPEHSPEYQASVPAKYWTAGDWGGVINKTKGMLITGCVAYKTFGEIHRTQYCILERRLPDDKTFATDCFKGTIAD